MKKFSFFSMLALLGVLVLNSGCSKTGPAGPAGSTGPAGPSLSGGINGHIFLYDQYGATVLAGLAGTRDSIVGTNQVAVADSNGLYKFGGLNTGTYNFAVAKAGYGSELAQSVQLVGGGSAIYHDFKIAQIPNFSFSAVSAAINTTTNPGNIDITGTITADTRTRSAILYLGKTASVSSAPATYENYYTGNIKAGTTTTITFSINPNDIHDLGINTGSTLYFAVYGAATTFASASVYQDYSTGHNVFTCISPTAANNSFVMP